MTEQQKELVKRYKLHVENHVAVVCKLDGKPCQLFSCMLKFECRFCVDKPETPNA